MPSLNQGVLPPFCSRADSASLSPRLRGKDLHCTSACKEAAQTPQQIHEMQTHVRMHYCCHQNGAVTMVMVNLVLTIQNHDGIAYPAL